MILLFLLLTLPLSYGGVHLPSCLSTRGEVIEHFDFPARESGLKKRILVFAGIHGDEPEARALGRKWIERLSRIKTPSNFWRIVPELNPDGTKFNTRYNVNKVDLNRNFPTKDWDELALSQWRDKLKSNPRRYPGPSGGSELETQCVLRHIEDFKPDLVVSIHTPYGQLDFDGPADKKIKTHLLPWKRLGTYPGSLGRYLWDEKNIPVLTIELRPGSKHDFSQVQDQLSDLL